MPHTLSPSLRRLPGILGMRSKRRGSAPGITMQQENLNALPLSCLLHLVRQESFMAPRLVCLDHIVASHQHFSKAPQPTACVAAHLSYSARDTPVFPQTSAAEHLYHFCPPLHLLAHLPQLVGEGERPLDGFGTAQKRKNSKSPGLPPSQTVRINCSPKFQQRFLGLFFHFRPV